MRDIPTNEKEDPNLAQLLKEREEPRCAKSKTDIDEPNRAMVLKESEDPKWT
jgi:hypothetical protein